MTEPRIPSSASLWMALALLAGPALAQDSEQTFFESIDVNVVNVEVYVTDRDGKRIHGLTRDDFQVFEDGKPVEISNFYAVSEGQVSQAVSAGTGAAEAEEGTAPAPAAPIIPPPGGRPRLPARRRSRRPGRGAPRRRSCTRPGRSWRRRRHSSMSVTIRELSAISLVRVAAMNSAGWCALRYAL